MADVEVSYKGSTIATMSDSGTTTLQTQGKYCEDDIVVAYTKPAAPTPTLETITKTYTPTTSQQTETLTAGAGYDAIGEVDVTVNAMPSGSATTPSTTITANPTISVSESGLITASVSKTQGVTPAVSAGYVANGTSGTITVNGSNTQQLTVYNGAHHAVSSGYTVTVSLTNPINSSEFENWAISQSQTGLTDWTQIGTITSATGNSTVTATEQHLLVATTASASACSNVPTTTGGIIQTGGGEYPVVFGFEVTGDGTITIDGVNYDD